MTSGNLLLHLKSESSFVDLVLSGLKPQKREWLLVKKEPLFSYLGDPTFYK